MAAKDPARRKAAASIAALTRWAKEDGKAQSAKALRGLTAKFEREADPDGVLPEAERQRRGHRLLRAHMTRLSLKAAAARAAT